MTTESKNTRPPVALVTGGSAGLGLALVAALADRGWQVITDGRDADRLRRATADLPVRAIAGDVRSAAHRARLADAVEELGRLDLLVHNASELGPMRTLAESPAYGLADVFATNVEAPLELSRLLLPHLLHSDGILLSVSSDAAVEHYGTWGLYGASKAALDHVTLTFGAETGVTAYAVDPGDMRTAMHQQAFPGEDISDRPLPGTVVPHLLALLTERPASGRYRAAELAPAVAS
ncbi:SDR family NAD(P)-dependent oxidoreductase [Nocardioides terrisoli]|uniref:SDR family NAD(P)-dependent oxidoreductase n=1 Tax=Nocardioides terrisoli TaxID=3388267 RepID=UPI00287B9074|nr:SDR family NAD(P)-dependent oxidoreductase [Nocardioides marmorisolisilvae]